MRTKKENTRKAENKNDQPISEDEFFKYQQKRSQKSEGIILKPKK